MKIYKFGIYGILALFLVFSAAALTIESPEQKTYTTTNPSMNISLVITSNITFDNITYQINNQSNLACQNCSSVNDTLTLSKGNYSLISKGTRGNYSEEQTVSFSVEQEINETPEDNETNVTDFSLTVAAPLNTTYNVTEISLDIKSNQTLDQISYILDSSNESIACENCSSYNTTLTVDEGNHTLIVKGLLEAIEKEVSVDFKVELDAEINDTPDDGTEEPRFSLGFNKLPKALMNDEISDEELSAIINENNLNPGIINRLIKTGKLGELSQQAIIDTQFNPPGILRKLLGLIGFKHKSHSELVYENYNASETVQQKMLARDDLPENYVNEIKKNFQKGLEKKLEQQEKKQTKAQAQTEVQADEQEEQQTKAYKAGKQNGKNQGKGTTTENNGKAKGKSNGKSSGSKGGTSSGKSSGKGKK